MHSTTSYYPFNYHSFYILSCHSLWRMNVKPLRGFTFILYSPSITDDQGHVSMQSDWNISVLPLLTWHVLRRRLLDLFQPNGTSRPKGISRPSIRYGLPSGSLCMQMDCISKEGMPTHLYEVPRVFMVWRHRHSWSDPAIEHSGSAADNPSSELPGDEVT